MLDCHSSCVSYGELDTQQFRIYTSSRHTTMSALSWSRVCVFVYNLSSSGHCQLLHIKTAAFTSQTDEGTETNPKH